MSKNFQTFESSNNSANSNCHCCAVVGKLLYGLNFGDQMGLEAEGDLDWDAATKGLVLSAFRSALILLPEYLDNYVTSLNWYGFLQSVHYTHSKILLSIPPNKDDLDFILTVHK